ncbi:hypothetical protein BD410DRAFT_795541 [Rickenella mellea]|uniref:Uncharacterized protein n=1 Tax=Rickenella mellea TaxID=50990 RepID=A0A4Y7PM27_9AGAM|nr:hypothetical protein BD410DRAFT_795541 [Rickenella mellea]
MDLEEKIGGAFERRKAVRRLSKHSKRGRRGNMSCRNKIRPRFPSHGVSRSASPHSEMCTWSHHCTKQTFSPNNRRDMTRTRRKLPGGRRCL